jgi:hypothetical protein
MLSTFPPPPSPMAMLAAEKVPTAVDFTEPDVEPEGADARAGEADVDEAVGDDGAEGEYAEGEYAEGEYAEGEYAEGGYAEGGYAEGGYAEGGYAEGEYAEGEYAEGECVEGGLVGDEGDAATGGEGECAEVDEGGRDALGDATEGGAYCAEAEYDAEAEAEGGGGDEDGTGRGAASARAWAPPEAPRLPGPPRSPDVGAQFLAKSAASAGARADEGALVLKDPFPATASLRAAAARAAPVDYGSIELTDDEMALVHGRPLWARLKRRRP